MGFINGKYRIIAKTIVPGTSGESSYTEIIGLVPKNAYVLKMFGRVTTAFTGVTKPKVSLGVTGDTDRYMVAQPIDKVVEFIIGKLLKSSDGIRKSATSLPDKYKKDLPHSMGFCEAMDKEMISSSAKPIIATFTSSSDTFDPTAGEVEFVIAFIDCN